jgi:Leucine-rich repeat (LRR) protein
MLGYLFLINAISGLKMLSQTLNFKIKGILSCTAIANANGINITHADMDGDLDIGGNNLEGIPFSLGEVTGDFKMDNNRITQLSGSPHWVGDSFYCRANQLQTLVGCPKSIGANFCCDENALTSLLHIPENIPGILSCANNRLTSFSDVRVKVGDVLDISRNPITSLSDLDKHVLECRKLDLSGCPIVEGGVGLIRINHLTEVIAYKTGEFERAAEIINRYLALCEQHVSMNSRMLRCKAELEREGLSQYAKL